MSPLRVVFDTNILVLFPMIDEDDRVFYDTAKSTGSYLVTGNKRHYPQKSFILTPTEFLEL